MYIVRHSCKICNALNSFAQAHLISQNDIFAAVPGLAKPVQAFQLVWLERARRNEGWRSNERALHPL